MKSHEKKEPSSKTLLYTYDVDEQYTYNINHGTEYPYNGFPPGLHGRRYKKTRFIEWEPIPEDIIIRHFGSQIVVNFCSVFPNDVPDPAIQLFQMRAKRVELQNLICEQINFFCALYDDDNDLITSMFIAKMMTDSETYTIATFEEYFEQLYEILFPPRTMEKIKKMVEENDVGDDVVGLFPEDFLRDMYIVSFMIKCMHIFIEHFIMSTGNSPKDLYELFAKAFTYAMNKINPNMYVLLYNYVSKSVAQSINSNSNIYDMQAIDGVTAPTTSQVVMRKILLCDGLIKLTFASAWDKINKRPTYSCVGLIKAIVLQASFLTRKTQLRYSLVNVDDISQLLSDNINSSSPISMIRSLNPGEYSCMVKDLNIIIAHIALEIDLSPVNYYLEHLPQMNDLSKILIDTVLYNKFHSSIPISTLNMKQKYILLLYVRYLVMQIYGLDEEAAKGNPLINILMGKTVSSTTRTLTQKDLNGIRKYIKLNNLKQYLLTEKDVNTFLENIMHCVLSSYTIVNHTDESLLGTPLMYDSGTMTMQLLDMVIELFEMMS
jgi:hypothetical protein